MYLKILAAVLTTILQSLKLRKKDNSQEYKDAWNKVIKNLDKKQFDDEVLTQLQDAIKNK